MKKIKQQSRESKLMLLKEYGYSVEINIGQPVWGGIAISY